MEHSELGLERIVRVEPPNHHFTLLRNRDGDYLGSDDGEGLQLYDYVDDKAVWNQLKPDTFSHPASNIELHIDSDSDGYLLSHKGAEVSADTKSSDEAATYTAHRGPALMPSDYLATFKENGWVCLASILSSDIVDELERVSCCGRWSDREYDRETPLLNQTAAVARASVEPVSLWLIRQYLSTEEIRLAHSPGLAVLTPDDGERDVQGWHSDFPYLWGITRKQGDDQRIPIGMSGELSMGVQRNICVSEFTHENGATCFKLGTHVLNSGPPEEWGTGSIYAQRGHRAAEGLPYDGPEADIIEAPGGSIILYDARTWHRAGVNRTDQRRAAILEAMTPSFLMPFVDTSLPYKQFMKGPVIDQLLKRDQTAFAELMVHKVIGPGGMGAITVDKELTELFQA
ncbi:MAG: phytanoyl-CoA dioxygenase family protein [Pseudomonadales bacterium]|jgi:hypothetical protein